MGYKAALTGIFGLFIAIALFFPAEGETASGGWDWQVTLMAPASGQAVQLPASLYVDKRRERYYLAEFAGNRLLSFTQEGEFLNAFSAKGELQDPYDLVRDEEGVFWVVEKGRNSLTSIDLKAHKIVPHTLTYQQQEMILDRLDYRDGRFYVLDRRSGGIALLNSDLAVERLITCPDCEGRFVDFKITTKGEIWTLTTNGDRVVKFSDDGRQLAGFRVGDRVCFPVSIAIGPTGNVYILDRHEGRVSVYDVRGNFKYAFLSKGRSRGQPYYPMEISFDPWGNLVVVEGGNGRAEIFRR